MNINIIYDASVATNPQEAAFKATVAGVAAFFDSEFSNPITINWDVGWGEVNGSPIPGGAGAESQSNYTNQYSYSQLKAAFTADNDTTALASLPATDPTAGGGFSMTTAEGKALGLVTASNAAIDGWSGLDTTSTWIYNTTNTAGGNVPAGDSDAFSFLAHELSEVMGRQMNFGANSGDGVAGDGYYPEDLFDYTANGVRALTNSATADRYFSTDGGTANTAQHYFNNVASAGDLFDYVPNGTPKSYLPTGSPDSFDYSGSVGIVSAGDLTLMATLGYTPSTAGTTIQWANQVSGAFATGSNWVGNVTPGPADTAVLGSKNTRGAAPDASKGTYTVTASASETVTAIQTAAVATLAITGGVFEATNGTGGGSNAGLIGVSSGATFEIGGTFNNSNKVYLLGGATLMVAAGGVSLTGTGIVELSETALSQASVGPRTTALVSTAPTATLSNDSTIEGGGNLGAGQLTLNNQAGGIIASVGAQTLSIDTGAASIANAGLILASGPGGVTIAGAINNTGHLAVNGGPMTVMGAVTGSGYGEVVSGTLDFAGSFNENVVFTAGSTGTLELADSVAYTKGRIQGLSTTGANALDLGDINFVNAATTTATFAGTATSGVVTVTDGTNTARINLIGNYVGHTFTTSLGAGGVGTKIVDPAASPTPAPSTLPAPPHAFIAAMAAVGPSAGAQTTARGGLEPSAHVLLAAPRFMQAA